MALQLGILSSSLQRLRFILPAAIVCAVVALVGLRGFRDPVSLLFVGAGSCGLLGIALVEMPLAIFWLVPVSMSAYIYLPLQHFEALVLAIVALMTMSALRDGHRLRIVLQPVELRYLAFLAVSLLSLPAAISLYRYGGALKVYVVGLLAFEVARRAARRFGRAAVLWGPAIFVSITVTTLVLRTAQSGVPVFRSILLRTYLSRLPWGSSNYVAAVMVLCLPALLLLYQESIEQPRRRQLVLGIIVGSLTNMFFTLSRGGFAMSIVCLAMFGFSGRRVPWRLLAAVAIGACAIAFLPLGQALFSRFTNAQSQDSILARVMIWSAALERGIHHLPFGVGLGQGWLQQDALQGIDPHNFPLTLFGELGPLGLLAWFWMIAALWAASGRLAGIPGTRAAATAMRATLMLGVLNSLFEPTLTGNLYHLLFWWLLGIYHGAGEPADLPVKGLVAAAD